MNDIQGPFTDLRTFVNGSIDGDNVSSAASQQLGLSSSLVTRRGKAVIATSEGRTNVAYGTLTTPDQVSVTLPTDGLISIVYKAQWSESVLNAARAAIFIGATQLKVPAVGGAGAGAVSVQEAHINAATANNGAILSSTPFGLVSLTQASGSGAFGADVTTGQALGTVMAAGGATRFNVGSDTVALATSFGVGGACYVFADAGTYTISVQYKASSGTVTASARKLYVWTQSF